MQKVILVTGVNGFVGKHLVRELATRGHSVIGLGHQEVTAANEIADFLDDYYQCDVSNQEQVAKLPLEKITAVINLAGLANVGASFENPELYVRVNVDVLKVLGSALFEKNPSARMIAVSTGGLYDPNQPMPLTEDSRVVENGSPYALSKLAMESAALELRDRGQDCIVVRPFNHIGPGQGLGFLLPDLVKKLQGADTNSPSLKAGNLKTIRDYTDVRDIVRAYADLATANTVQGSLYNICSGNGRSGNEIVQEICNALGISFENLNITVDESLVRPSDPEKIIGSHQKLTIDTGWEPEIPLSKTIIDIINQP